MGFGFRGIRLNDLGRFQSRLGLSRFRVYWVAVNELKVSYYIGETLLCTIYTHYGKGGAGKCGFGVLGFGMPLKAYTYKLYIPYVP